ncbi:MAG: 4-aminobutyrate--2-oxoglutarate transaminase [Actinomycetia bacterium]|nr:4-aminobutyrate--2-oxoglutarate transaminase [Actinomycetes bacterium]
MKLPQSRLLKTEIPGPKSQAITERRSAAVSAGIGMALPIFVQDAAGGILQDVDGNRLIDLGSGIAVTTVGNAAPSVVAAAHEQAQRVTHTCFMVTGYEPYVALCERLNTVTPGSHPKRSALFNSGAEAVENAVKIARAHTGKRAVVAVEHAYHGRTNLTMALTAKQMPFKKSFGPFASDIYRVPTSYPLRDQLTGPAAAERAIERIEAEIGHHDLAALIIEPIQGEGGFIVPAPGFLPALSQWCADNDVVFIADEVQTGFCRTGSWFACDHEGVVPDLIVTAKGIADGYPISAVTGRANIMDSVHTGGLGGTYGGNPVCCAAALATIDLMEEHDLAARAREIEVVIRQTLTDALADSGVVAQIRGRGALMAVEFRDPASGRHLPDLAKAIAAECGRRGVVILTAGTLGNVVRLLPPLVIDDDLLREGLGIFADALIEAESAHLKESA